jgi:acyl transferase domain-containing protein
VVTQRKPWRRRRRLQRHGSIPGALVGGIYGASKGNDATFGDRYGSFSPTGNASQLQQALQNRSAALTGTKTTADPNVLKDQIAKEQQRLALLGPLANAEDAVKAKQLEINAAALNGVGISRDQAKAVLDVTRAQAEMSRVQEQAALGITRTAEATKAMNDNLQSLITRKLLDPNNPQEYAAALNTLTKQMEDLSDQAKVAGAALPQLQQAMNDATSARKQLDGLAVEAMSVNRGLFVEFGQQLRQGASAWEAFKSAGLNALGKLADKLMSMAADNLFAKAFGGSSGGLASLFGLGGSGSTPVMSAAGDLGAGTGGLSFPMFAGGTDSAPGGLSIVGEKGPELINLPRGAQVFNAGQTRGMMGDQGGPPVVMNDNRVLNIGQGASADTVLQLREELARDKAARYADTVRIVQSAKKRREL